MAAAAEKQGALVPAGKPVLEAHIINPPVPPSEMSDAELGAEAARAVERHLAMRESAVESAVRAGELLREARARCDAAKRSWRDWLTRYWPKSRQTAQRYMALALEVQQISGPRAGRNLLGLPSIRAALTEADYDAGGAQGSADPEDQEADEERTMERLVADANAEPEARPEREPTPRPGPPMGRRAEEKSDAEKARQAAAAADAAKWRAQVEEAGKRPPLVQAPPENPHQVGHSKPPAPAGDGQEIPCSAADLKEVAEAIAAAERQLLLAVSDFNRVVGKLCAIDGNTEREDIVATARDHLATATGALKKVPGAVRHLADLDSRLVGVERERRHKAAKKRKGA